MAYIFVRLPSWLAGYLILQARYLACGCGVRRPHTLIEKFYFSYDIPLLNALYNHNSYSSSQPMAMVMLPVKARNHLENYER
jgi:hypothetical protein